MRKNSIYISLGPYSALQHQHHTMKDIWKALVIAFLLFIIPLIWNYITKGGVIRALGGVTRNDTWEVTIGNPAVPGVLATSKSGGSTVVRAEGSPDPWSRWILHLKSHSTK